MEGRPKKAFRLRRDQLEPVAVGLGACFATDRITVDGCRVGYMYREEPEFPEDSGWRFTAGDESAGYIGNADNVGIYDVNTIANYDGEIVPFLESPIGSRFARDEEGKLIRQPGELPRRPTG